MQGFVVLVKDRPENIMDPKIFFTHEEMEPFMNTATRGGWDTHTVLARLEAFAVAEFDATSEVLEEGREHWLRVWWRRRTKRRNKLVTHCCVRGERDG